MRCTLIPMSYLNKLLCTLLIIILMSIQNLPAQSNEHKKEQYSPQEIIDAGHIFFGSTSGALAKLIEHVFKKHGQPNGYILGQQVSGAIIGGLTYGEGILYTKNAGQHNTFWQGPSIGFDYGGEGTRTMMLVYHLPNIESIYQRFGGVSGSAYVVAGIGVTVMRHKDILLVPIQTGVGARFGVNAGYLKLTPKPTWNPF